MNKIDSHWSCRQSKKYKCYANLATGSYSRPCVVHNDFKIIVHIPASSLSDNPLPFLNRFEKYPISLEQALSYKLLLVPDWEGVCNFGFLALNSYDITGVHKYRQESTNFRHRERGMRRYGKSASFQPNSRTITVSNSFSKYKIATFLYSFTQTRYSLVQRESVASLMLTFVKRYLQLGILWDLLGVDCFFAGDDNEVLICGSSVGFEERS